MFYVYNLNSYRKPIFNQIRKLRAADIKYLIGKE